MDPWPVEAAAQQPRDALECEEGRKKGVSTVERKEDKEEGDGACFYLRCPPRVSERHIDTDGGKEEKSAAASGILLGRSSHATQIRAT
eukprot:scaffold1199_cov265-Pinguiococcus_pyrenoidosus.AAC.11